MLFNSYFGGEKTWIHTFHNAIYPFTLLESKAFGIKKIDHRSSMGLLILVEICDIFVFADTVSAHV